MPGIARYQQMGNNLGYLLLIAASQVVAVVLMVLFVCWETDLIGQDNMGRGFLAGGSFLLLVSAEGVAAVVAGHRRRPGPRLPTSPLLTAATGSAAAPLIAFGLLACFG